MGRIIPEKAPNIKFSAFDLLKTYIPAVDERDDDTWYIGEMLRNRDSGLKFQDFGSIKRNFGEYCGHTIELSQTEKDTIAFYLECRHSIVHSGGRTDSKFIHAMSVIGGPYATQFKINNQIVLTSNDWTSIKETFGKLITDTSNRSTDLST